MKDASKKSFLNTAGFIEETTNKEIPLKITIIPKETKFTVGLLH